MNELYIYRSIFAVGAAALSSVLAIIVNDYPTEQSRGKFVSLHSVLNALGVAIFAAFLGRLPTVFTNIGYDPITAGRFTMLFVAGLAFLSGLIFAVGLKGGTPENQKEKLGFKHLMATGIRVHEEP